MSLVSRLDRLQRRHRWFGLPLAVFYKFFDDVGAQMAALLTYYALVSLFPLLLLGLSILGFVLQGRPALQEQLVSATLDVVPLEAAQLRSNVQTFGGSTTAVVVGVLGSLYGALGLGVALQNALNTVWQVPRNRRPNPFQARVHSLGLLGLGALVIVLTTALTAIPQAVSSLGRRIGTIGNLGVSVVVVLLDIAIFWLVFRRLTAVTLPWRSHLSGAVLAGVSWYLMQNLGTVFVTRVVTGDSATYGVFAVVLGLIAWLFLLSTLLVFAAEVNVVVARRLWPRALMTPFTDAVDLTGADRRAYRGYATAQRFKGFETVDVSFDGAREGPAEDPDPPG